MSLNKFPAVHSPLWRRYRRWTSLHRGTSSRRRLIPLLCLFDNHSHLHYRQGFVTVNLLDNFLNILKLFLVVESDFTNHYNEEWTG